MAIEMEFEEAVRTGNRRMVRIKLANSITIDPTLKTFEEMKEYAETRISDLFDAHQGILLTDRGEWTKDYYDKQQTELSFNFSRERLQLVCDMAVYLYSDRIKTINENREREKKPSHSSAQVAGGVAIGGGLLAAGIGAIAKAPLLVGIGIAAAVIGAVVLIKESQD
jgi:hypothetical protein